MKNAVHKATNNQAFKAFPVLVGSLLAVVLAAAVGGTYLLTHSVPDGKQTTSNPLVSQETQEATSAESSSRASVAASNPASASTSVTATDLSTDVSDTAIPQALQEQIDAEKAARAAEEEAARLAALDVSASVSPQRVLNLVPDGSGIATFSLNDQRPAPTMDKANLEAIQLAADAITSRGYACGALIVDLKSGLGVAYNAADPLYTASSFKAPFSYYVLSNGLATQVDRNNIEPSILYSDNDAYEALARSYYLTEAYQAWLTNYGIVYDAWSPWYPDASAQSMAACWADIFHFLENGGEDAAWFEDLLARTNISFIRTALEGEDVVVLNKAGWMAEADYNAVVDCALVRVGGRSFILAVLSDQPSSGQAQENIQALARALYDCGIGFAAVS